MDLGQRSDFTYCKEPKLNFGVVFECRFITLSLLLGMCNLSAMVAFGLVVLVKMVWN